MAALEFVLDWQDRLRTALRNNRQQTLHRNARGCCGTLRAMSPTVSILESICKVLAILHLGSVIVKNEAFVNSIFRIKSVVSQVTLVTGKNIESSLLDTSTA